jgi:hypothetical protein
MQVALWWQRDRPEYVATIEASYTGQFLRPLLFEER